MEYLALQLTASAAGFISGAIVGATWARSNLIDRRKP